MYVKDHPVSIIPSLQVLTENDLMRTGRRMIPIRYYVHGYHTEATIEEHEHRQGEKFDKWKEWLNDGRIYIDKPEEDMLI